MKSFSLLAFLLSLLGAAGGAQASSSDWFEVEGARLRLVTTGKPDADGKLKGILDIDLVPGWKTYWRDPGDAGVPPSIDVTANPGIAGIRIDFPAPQLHDEGDFKWAGYDRPLALPVSFTLRDKSSGQIKANVFLGICETICVPVQATLAVDPDQDPDNLGDKAAVSAALAATPPAATSEFGVKVVGKPKDGTLLLDASFPGDPETAQLFIAGEQGYTFTHPVRERRDGKTFFSTKVGIPVGVARGDGLHYTLVTNAGAVNGFIPYF